MARLTVHRFGPSLGSGLPVLALHAVRSSGRRFRRLAEEGLVGRRVLAPDLRGHGDSTWDPPWDAATHVADLLETLDAEGVGRVAILGHSFGGLLAMHLAAIAPERVERVLLLDPAIAMPAGRMAQFAEETRHDDGWPTRQDALAARLAGRSPQAIPDVLEDLETNLRQDPDGRFRLRFSRPAVIVGWSEIAKPQLSLASYPGVVLLVIADRGECVMPWFRTKLGRDLGPRLNERTIAAGHVVFWDAFEETAAMASAFLAGLPVPEVAQPVASPVVTPTTQG